MIPVVQKELRYIGPLEVPKFMMMDQKEPVSLSETLLVVRKPNPVGVSLPHWTCPPRDHPISTHTTLNKNTFIVSPISERSSEKSLQLVLGDRFKLYLPRLKLLALNDNAKGKFSTVFRLNSILVLRTFALVEGTVSLLNSQNPEFFCAYGIKSFFHPLSSENPIKTHFHICKMIHAFFNANWIESLPSMEFHTKFGGGLSRKTASHTSSAQTQQQARYCIRGLVEELKGALSEDEWRRRGATGFEHDANFILIRFTRIEQRDYACDSFILGFDIAGSEIGLSQVRTPKGLVLVSIENNAPTLDFKPIDLPRLFSPNSPIMPPPLPLPRPR